MLRPTQSSDRQQHSEAREKVGPCQPCFIDMRELSCSAPGIQRALNYDPLLGKRPFRWSEIQNSACQVFQAALSESLEQLIACPNGW